jgi:hypothetical protein
MNLCHEATPVILEGKTEFSGPSPDEVTFIKASKDIGYLYLKDVQANQFKI